MPVNEKRTPYFLVKEFHETYGQVIRTEPQFDIPEKAMRIALIVEEAEEYAQADSQDDFIEVVDALADLVYVAVGAGLTHGLVVDRPQHVMVKRDKPTLEIKERDIVSNYLVNAVSVYLKQAEAADGDVNELKINLENVVEAAYQAAGLFGVDLDDILQEVQRSNMSKLGVDGLPIYREDGKVLKGPNFFVPDVAAVLKNQGWVEEN